MDRPSVDSRRGLENSSIRRRGVHKLACLVIRTGVEKIYLDNTAKFRDWQVRPRKSLFIRVRDRKNSQDERKDPAMDVWPVSHVVLNTLSYPRLGVLILIRLMSVQQPWHSDYPPIMLRHFSYEILHLTRVCFYGDDCDFWYMLIILAIKSYH